MRRSLALLTIACLSSLAFTTIASADLVSGRCQKVIEDEIAGLTIPKDRIKDVSILNIYDGNGEGGGRIDHIEGWVSFSDCKGNLVISVSNACLPMETYTTYQCRVPGVANY
ncbi:hypothetical protein [uncultured Sneathiella sp.]|uniref:hypothetical protein n=1 Tax=uncultured Sneathiella sp. TaxID=879315 RepID=UPI0030EDAB3B|tara:strand:+ start:23558 stop:23893 length:336 start_codon:yes stop_codon:yes gene_type:complete